MYVYLCVYVCEFDCLLVVLYFYRNTISLRVYEPHTLVSCTQLRKPFLCQVSRITTMRDDAKARSLSLSAHAANFKWVKLFVQPTSRAGKKHRPGNGATFELKHR